ncbi:MAG: hypothetical protein U5K37_08845 [Natrialbaceae archaeon]|nr:hypothetical protein [Natrialbaceae archaeon]
MFDTIFSIGAWTVLLIFFIATAYWVIEVLVVGQSRNQPGKYGHSDIHVRILTIDAQAVVQGTVDSLPDDLGGVTVIAERPIAIDGATVHVVPDTFSCNAQQKGRAVEWARQDRSRG